MRLTLLLTLAAALWAAEPKPAGPKASAPPPPPRVVQLTTTQRLAYQAITRMLDEVQMEVCAGARIPPDRCVVEWQGGIVREAVPPPDAPAPTPAPPPPPPPEAKEERAK